MQGSVRAVKAAPKLHNYNSTRNKNSDTQKYIHNAHDAWGSVRIAHVSQQFLHDNRKCLRRNNGHLITLQI